MFAALTEEIADLTKRKRQAEKNELDHRNAQIDSAAIPGKDDLDRIYRYQTSNRRHRYRVQARLDQLQARREEVEKAEHFIGGEDTEKPENM